MGVRKRKRKTRDVRAAVAGDDVDTSLRLTLREWPLNLLPGAHREHSVCARRARCGVQDAACKMRRAGVRDVACKEGTKH